MKKRLPAVILFFLSPLIAELLLSSAPPAEFFNPVMLVVLTVLYGGGAILIRETVIRWQKGWASLLVLGAAYAIIEEGLMVKSFFDPNWVDIGILGSYGRWVGVNWVWSLQLIVYHAVISIAVPILITEMVFKDRRNQSWVGKKGFIILLILFVIDIIFGYAVLTPYRPGVVQYWLAVVVVAVLIIIAWRLPRRIFSPRATTLRKSFRFWLTGFLGTLAFFLIFWALPNTGIHPLVTMLIIVCWIGIIGWLVLRMSGNGSAWTDRQRLALVSGPLSLFIVLAPVHEFDTSRVDNTTGMTVVGIAALLFLLWLWRRVRKYPVEAGEAVEPQGDANSV